MHLLFSKLGQVLLKFYWLVDSARSHRVLKHVDLPFETDGEVRIRNIDQSTQLLPMAPKHPHMKMEDPGACYPCPFVVPHPH